MRAFIFPYKAGSESCKALSEALGIKRIANTNSKFVGDGNTLVINWGSSTVTPEIAKCRLLNPPNAVNLASNKLHTFKKLADTGVMPQFTTDAGTAYGWMKKEGVVVIERHKLQGNSGEGIRVVERQVDLQNCPLYVLYVPKKQEYRVHVAGGLVVDVQRKARRHDVPDDQINWKIRNHDNGFIFARKEELGDVPEDVLEKSVIAVEELGLDFGAVDVVFNEKQQRAYVLEVNTAPGLSGSTLEGYVARFKDIINGVEIVKPVANPAARVPQPILAGGGEINFNPDWLVDDRPQARVDRQREALGAARKAHHEWMMKHAAELVNAKLG